jgi:aspartate aminotransferase
MSNNIIAERLSLIKPSPILSISSKAKLLAAQGKSMLDLSTGEPDFPTPQNICQAAKDAMDQGSTNYTICDGTIELKQAVIDKFRRENGLDYQINQISVSAGAKKILYNLFLSTVNPGDEVIIPAPYWASYPDMAALAEGKSIICNTNERFILEPQTLEQAITPKTKWLLINSPNNPSGAVYTKQDLAKLAEVLLQHPHVHIISDDIYEHITYPPKQFTTIAAVEPRLYERTFTVCGVSKAYSMTGWRIGYVGGGKPEVIKAMAKVQSQTITCPSSISQAATIEALNGPQNFISDRNKAFQKRRDYLTKEINSIDGLEAKTPDGAFYLLISCQGLIGKKTPAGRIIANDKDFCEYLLENYYVAAVPGIVFGFKNFFRISYATKDDVLKKSCEAIRKACQKLK